MTTMFSLVTPPPKMSPVGPVAAAAPSRGAAVYSSAAAQINTMPNSLMAAGRRRYNTCLLYTSDAADDLLCVDLGGRRIIKKNY